jgi:hypothetical protein
MLTKDDHTGRSVTNFLILRPCKLDHGLGSGMSDIDLAEYGVTVIGQSTNQPPSTI